MTSSNTLKVVQSSVRHVVCVRYVTTCRSTLFYVSYQELPPKPFPTYKSGSKYLARLHLWFCLFDTLWPLLNIFEVNQIEYWILKWIKVAEPVTWVPFSTTNQSGSKYLPPFSLVKIILNPWRLWVMFNSYTVCQWMTVTLSLHMVPIKHTSYRCALILMPVIQG